jgi:hypothetical protein
MYAEEFILDRVEPAYDDHDIYSNVRGCTERWNGWSCTRRKGHADDHEAMDSVEWICARWGVDR